MKQQFLNYLRIFDSVYVLNLIYHLDICTRFRRFCKNGVSDTYLYVDAERECKHNYIDNYRDAAHESV